MTDDKELFDHLQTTGSVSKERQTMIDLMVVVDLVETQMVADRWT